MYNEVAVTAYSIWALFGVTFIGAYAYSKIVDKT